jgi:hypothetical protein
MLKLVALQNGVTNCCPRQALGRQGQWREKNRGIVGLAARQSK